MNDNISSTEKEPDMQRIKRLWSRLFPNRHRALDKRRLEHILQDEGMSRSVSRRIVQRYFSGSLTIHRG